MLTGKLLSNTSDFFKQNLSATKAIQNFNSQRRSDYNELISEGTETVKVNTKSAKEGELNRKKIEKFGKLAQKKYDLTEKQITMNVIRGDGVDGIGLDLVATLYILEHSTLLEKLGHSSFTNKKGKHFILKGASTVTGKTIAFHFILEKKYTVLLSVQAGDETVYGADAAAMLLPFAHDQEDEE